MYKTFIYLPLLLLTVFLSPSLGAETVQPMDRYFPVYTANITSIRDIQQIVSRWDETDMGKLLNDPSMKAFQESLRTQFSENITQLNDRLGITVADLRTMVGGEVAFGTIYPNKDLASMALIANITDHNAEATLVINKVCDQINKQKGKVTRQKVAAAEFIQCDFKDENGRNQKIIYVLDNNILIVCDNLAITKLLWQKTMNAPAAAKIPSLYQNLYYQQVLKKCQLRFPNSDVFLFFQIDRYIEVVRAISERVSGKPPKAEHPYTKMTEAGFNAPKSVGVAFNMKQGAYDRSGCAYILAPKPWTRSMNMFSFPNAGYQNPPEWVSTDISSYAMMNVSPQDMFDNIGPMFDAYFGEGEKGVWNDVIEGLEKDPYGPQINLKEQLINHFDGSIILITEAIEPITTDSQRVGIALKVRDDTAVKTALTKLFSDDPDIHLQKYGDIDIWQYQQPKEKATSGLSLPKLGQAKKTKKNDQPMANAAFTVNNGYLFIVNKPDYFKVLMAPKAPNKQLKNDTDYIRTIADLNKISGGKATLWTYNPTANSFKLTYDLFKQGKLRDAKTLLGRLINEILDNEDLKIELPQRLDTSSLPEFNKIRDSFGPAGSCMTTDENGFYVEGFLLPVK